MLEQTLGKNKWRDLSVCTEDGDSVFSHVSLYRRQQNHVYIYCQCIPIGLEYIVSLTMLRNKGITYNVMLDRTLTVLMMQFVERRSPLV